MTPTSASVISLPGEAPTEQEIEGARHSIMSARIERRAVDIPPDIAATILGPDGAPLTPERLFPFLARPSNSLPDTYFTYQPVPTLENYAQNAIDGVALMLAHDIYEMPVGYSYNGWVEVDEFATPEERAAAIEARGGVRYLNMLPMGVNDPLAWLYVNFYMQRGLSLGKKPNDEVIAGIMSGTVRDMSITFFAKVLRCNICHLDIYDWSWDGGCPHIPGVEYDLGDLGTVTCIAAVEDGQMVEVSLVYKGATPGAQIVEVKSRMVADSGRLSSGEARQLAALEAKLGRRLVDPSHLQRALGKTVTVPALAVGKTTVARTIQTPQQKEKNMARTVTPGKPARTRDVATGTGTTTDTTTTASGNTLDDIETVLADQATSDAAALAQQVTDAQAAIQTQQGVIDGLNAQIAALQNDTTTDGNGNPVDHTAEIDSLNTQLQAATDQMAVLNADLAALQAELDGVNATAAATGGTPGDPAAATPPVTDSGSPVVQSQQAVRRIRSALQTVQGIFRSHIAPNRHHMRTISDADLQPIIDQAQSILNDLQALLDAAPASTTDTGTTTTTSNALRLRTTADRVAFGAISRSLNIPIGRLGFSHIRALLDEATAGRIYLKDLQDECVRERVRAMGAENMDEERYRKMLRNLDVESLKAERDSQKTAASRVFTPGRRLLPADGTGSVDVPTPPANTAAGGNQSQNGQTAPAPFAH